jgi:hypothetical protein
VGHRLVGQDGGEELGDLGEFVQLMHGGRTLLWRCGGPACIRSVTGRVAASRGRSLFPQATDDSDHPCHTSARR